MNTNMHPRFFKAVVRVFVLVLALAAALSAMGAKEGWHIDEIATLGLANGSQAGYITAYDDSRYGRGAFIQETILGDSFADLIGNVKGILGDLAENGLSGFSIRDKYVAYREESSPVWKRGTEFAEYLAADGFSLKDVYLNQALDTHPPLYYLFVRIAYALFGAFGGAGFTLWPAFWVNALFLCLCCLMLMHIGETRFGSFGLGAGSALFFALSPAGLSLAVYMRMYMTLCFFVLLNLDAHLALRQRGWKFDRKTGWYLALSCAFGFMTHYYFAIWALMCAAVCFVQMLLDKCPRRVFGYIGRMAGGVAISLVLWPLSPVHLLLSNRSAEAVGALTGGALEKLSSSLEIFLNHMFGAPVLVPVVLFALGIIFALLRRKTAEERTPIAIVALPAALYLAIVFVIAPYEDLRYMACAVPLCSMAAAWCLWQIARLMRGETARCVLCVLLCLCVGASGTLTQPPMYLFPGTRETRAYAEECAGKPCVYLTSSGAAFYREMPDFAAYDEVLIVNKQELSLLEQDETIAAADELVLYIHDSYPQTEAMHAVLELTGFAEYEVLAQSHAGLDARVYLLKR